jgi:hypothetical protein
MLQFYRKIRIQLWQSVPSFGDKPFPGWKPLMAELPFGNPLR